MGTPLELIKYNTDSGTFEIGKAALDTLRKVKGPVAVVAVCGRARQGKSFILNQLLLKSSGGGFQVTAADGSKHHLVLLDTEGIDAYDQTAQYSTQIFSLAVLLSSMFVYNQLEEEGGPKITPRDYLETALRPVPGAGPALEEEGGRKAGVKQLTEMILSRAQPKRFGSMGAMTGPVLAGLVGAYVGAMNNGAVPTIATAWQSCLAAARAAFEDIAVGDEAIKRAHEQRWQQRLAAFVAGYDKAAAGPTKWVKLAAWLGETWPAAAGQAERLAADAGASSASLQTQLAALQQEAARLRAAADQKAAKVAALEAQMSEVLLVSERKQASAGELAEARAALTAERARAASLTADLEGLTVRCGAAESRLAAREAEADEWRGKYGREAAARLSREIKDALTQAGFMDEVWALTNRKPAPKKADWPAAPTQPAVYQS
eukprot:XP_001698821.1 predicted protein [Chlamydomonas reinhardtii]